MTTVSTPQTIHRVDRGIGWGFAAVVVAAWIVLLGLHFIGRFTLDVAFFLAAFVLAAAIFLASLYAAARLFEHHRLHRADRMPNLLPVPTWLATYARYLTPVGFVAGIIFGHYFWH